MSHQPLRYIGAQIEVVFDQEPLFTKKPDCPDHFIWEDEKFSITEILSAWHDFGRRGQMARNMRPANMAKALRRGSWGVGRFYFRVRTEKGRIFELYYDRAPKDAGDRAGSWFLDRELAETGGQ